jgi:uncharacterized protein YcbK (DUF882 family)
VSVVRGAVAVAVAGVLVATVGAHAEPARFRVMGTGTLALENAHTHERASVRYRRADGSYDAASLARLDRLFRSGGGGDMTEMSLRLIEVLSHVQRLAGGAPVVLISGYRSREYNESIRDRGGRAASGSLHTEGLAADVAFPRTKLRALWMQVRHLDCCGAGLYAKQGFLHIDVGQPRFWEPATSRVEENLSAGNARLFARTTFDVYEPGETIEVRLHSLSLPPVLLSRKATLVGEQGDTMGALRVDADVPERDGCLEATTGVRLRVGGAAAGSHGRVVLATCAPRLERTPEQVETNVLQLQTRESPVATDSRP